MQASKPVRVGKKLEGERERTQREPGFEPGVTVLQTRPAEEPMPRTVPAAASAADGPDRTRREQGPASSCRSSAARCQDDRNGLQTGAAPGPGDKIGGGTRI